MTSFEKLNDKNVNVMERIAYARNLLTSPEDEESIHAAKCFLTYRCLDGLILFPDWEEKIEPVYCPHISTESRLNFRWSASQLIAQIYLYLKAGKVDDFLQSASLMQIMYKKNSDQWPPSILNYLRSQFLFLYYQYVKQNPNYPIAFRCSDVINEWKTVVSEIDYDEFPFRFAEMKEDCNDLLALIELRRKLGALKDNREFDWCTPNYILKRWPTIMRNAVKSISFFNLETSIWKY